LFALVTTKKFQQNFIKFTDLTMVKTGASVKISKTISEGVNSGKIRSVKKPGAYGIT
jgi:hypothetical protein